MTRRHLENRIQSIESEQQQQQEHTDGIYVIYHQPDGSMINGDTGEPITESELPDKNGIVIHYEDDSCL